MSSNILNDENKEKTLTFKDVCWLDFMQEIDKIKESSSLEPEDFNMDPNHESIAQLFGKFDQKSLPLSNLEGRSKVRYFHFNDLSQYAFSSLCLRYNGVKYIEQIKNVNDEESFLFKLEEIFSMGVIFRNEKFSKTRIPHEIYWDLDKNHWDFYVDSCRVLNVAFRGANNDSFCRRIIPRDSANFEEINKFLNDKEWVGKAYLRVNDRFDHLSEEFNGYTLGQFIYLHFVLDMIKGQKRGDPLYKDKSIRVLILYIIKLMQCKDDEIDDIIKSFEVFLSSEGCENCAYDDLRIRKFPYDWNCCDSFSKIIKTTKEIVPEVVTLAHNFTKNRHKKVSMSRHMVKYFGVHGILCVPSVTDMMKSEEANEQNSFGSVKVRAKDWFMLTVILDFASTFFKFYERFGTREGYIIYIEDYGLDYNEPHSDIFDNFIPALRSMIDDDKNNEYFYMNLLLFLYTGNVYDKILTEYINYRRIQKMSLHAAVAYAFKRSIPNTRELGLLKYVFKLSYNRDQWIYYMNTLAREKRIAKVTNSMELIWELDGRDPEDVSSKSSKNSSFSEEEKTEYLGKFVKRTETPMNWVDSYYVNYSNSPCSSRSLLPTYRRKTKYTFNVYAKKDSRKLQRIPESNDILESQEVKKILKKQRPFSS